MLNRYNLGTVKNCESGPFGELEMSRSRGPIACVGESVDAEERIDATITPNPRVSSNISPDRQPSGKFPDAVRSPALRAERRACPCPS